jgi:hypothetical protein
LQPATPIGRAERATCPLRGICGQSGDLLDAIGFLVDLDFTSG